MNNESREVRREFELTRARFETEVEHAEAVIPDLRAMQAVALHVMEKLRAKGKTKKLEEVAAGYAQLVARELQLVDGMARIRSLLANLEASIAHSEALQAERDQ